jgi:hypothetical protein
MVMPASLLVPGTYPDTAGIGFPEVYAPTERPNALAFYDVLVHAKQPTQSRRWPLCVARDAEAAANALRKLSPGGTMSLLSEVVALRGGWRSSADAQEDTDAREIVLSFVREVVLPPSSNENFGADRSSFSVLETEPTNGEWPALRPMVKPARGGREDLTTLSFEPVSAASVAGEAAEPDVAAQQQSQQRPPGLSRRFEPSLADVIQPPPAKVIEGEVMPFVEPHATFEAASGQPVEEFEKAARITAEMVTRHELVTADGSTRTYALVQFVFDARTGIFVSSSSLNYFATFDSHNTYEDPFAVVLG